LVFGVLLEYHVKNFSRKLVDGCLRCSKEVDPTLEPVSFLSSRTQLTLQPSNVEVELLKRVPLLVEL
jgi:hypothetical protein